MENAKPMGTPMQPNSKLDKGETEKDVDETRYKGMIGSLMYLTSSRPDIVQSVGLCSRFQSKPKESHLSAVKRIIRYVHGTSNFGLWYPKIDDFSAVGYCDADFAGDRVDRRSTQAYLKIQLADYKLNAENIFLMCDNMSAINISKNPVLHSRTKHIEVKFHSIREHVQKGDISIQFVKSEEQLADIFTKPLAEDRFCMLRTCLGILSYDSLFEKC
ncbi:hypothetical protein AAHE18_03G199200 [Arachis hypogaea]